MPVAVPFLQEIVDNFTYLGIFVVLLLGSLGVPIPEEMPIVAAAVLSHEGNVRWWLALPVCLVGVLSGDVVLHWVGRHWQLKKVGIRTDAGMITLTGEVTTIGASAKASEMARGVPGVKSVNNELTLAR